MGYAFCTVARFANGRLKANFVSIDGREEQHSEGSYYIEWYDGSKACADPLGRMPWPPRQNAISTNRCSPRKRTG